MSSSDKNEILLAIEKLDQKIDYVKEDLRQEMQEQLKVIPEMQKQLGIMPEMQKQLGAIPEMQKQLGIIPEMQKQLGIIPEMQKQLGVIPEMQREIRNISRTVARMEVEHGEKLAALFDAFTAHSEKLDIHDKRISICEKHIEHQSNQIYNLNSKVQEL